MLVPSEVTEKPNLWGDQIDAPTPEIPDQQETETPESKPENVTPGQTQEPEVTPDPETQSPADQEPPYVQTLKQELSDLKAWRVEQEKIRADEQKRVESQPPKPLTDNDWKDVEKRWGMSVTETQDETGKTSKSLNLDHRTFLDTNIKTISRAMEILRSELMNEIHGNTAPSRVESTVNALEHRQENPLKDIRQFLPIIREYLSQWHETRNHADPKVIEAAYWHAKGKSATNGQNSNQPQRKIVHPSQAKGGPAPAKGTISPEERNSMQGMMIDGRPITDAEWIRARDGR